MFQHRAQPMWIDQFVLRGNGSGEILSPFSQAMAAAELLATVADDRSGLPRATYERVRVAGHQIEMLADLAVRLENDFRSALRASDTAEHGSVDPSERARTMMTSLKGAVEANATLIEVCHALLEVAEVLSVINRQKSRIELVAAIEGLRGAASTAMVTVNSSLGRITDARTFDRLAAKAAQADDTLMYAGQLSATVRAATRPSQAFPPQRQEYARDSSGHTSLHTWSVLS